MWASGLINRLILLCKGLVGVGSLSSGTVFLSSLLLEDGAFKASSWKQRLGPDQTSNLLAP
jgi:hypothetical protein